MSDLIHHLVTAVIAIAVYDLLFIEPRLKEYREEAERWEGMCHLGTTLTELQAELIRKLIQERRE